MASAFRVRTEIERFLTSLTLSRVDRFYPTAVAKSLQISPGEAFKYLVERIGDDDQLILLWEVRCPNCSRTIEIKNDKTISEYDCVCGEEEIDVNNLYPVFKINPSFREYIFSEQEKKKFKLALKPKSIIPSLLT